MYISSCPSLRDLESTLTHMRTQEVMHTPSCLCFTEYPHRFIHECTSVYSCADKMHVYFQHFFSSSETRTYTRQHTYPCTCVVRVCLHLRLHTSHACKQVRLCMPQRTCHLPLRPRLRSLAHVHIHMLTHALITRVHSPQHLSTFVLTRHGAWSYDRCVHTCPSEACLYMSIHVPHARVSMLLCTRLNTYLHTLVHHPQVPWRYVRICHLAHIT